MQLVSCPDVAADRDFIFLQMKKLSLAWNYVDDEASEDLKRCLHKIKCLDLKSNPISDHVRRSLQNNSSGCEIMF